MSWGMLNWEYHWQKNHLASQSSLEEGEENDNRRGLRHAVDWSKTCFSHVILWTITAAPTDQVYRMSTTIYYRLTTKPRHDAHIVMTMHQLALIAHLLPKARWDMTKKKVTRVQISYTKIQMFWLGDICLMFFVSSLLCSTRLHLEDQNWLLSYNLKTPWGENQAFNVVYIHMWCF